MTERVRLAVGILTYRRPEKLRRGLALVLEQARAVAPEVEAVVIVVDNDPHGSARPIADEFSGPGFRYVVERTPGIAAARNRALDEAADADLLVFIDDDEWPQPEWLSSLVATWRATRAAAVTGRVISRFEHDGAPWITAGEFFRRRRLPSGAETDVAATGNLLLDLGQVRAIGVRFDERLALGGGEDTLFSRQLVRGGGRIVWCDESAAVDYVPPARTTRQWVLARALSQGNISTRVDLLLASNPSEALRVRVLAVLRGLLRIAGGTARFTGGLALRSHRHQARGLRAVYRGVGMALGAVGYAHEEYARTLQPAGSSAEVHA